MLGVLREYNLEKESIYVSVAGGSRSTNGLAFVFNTKKLEHRHRES